MLVLDDVFYGNLKRIHMDGFTKLVKQKLPPVMRSMTSVYVGFTTVFT
jgi:hypothetical protein